MVSNQRGDQLFLQENELLLLKESLKRHGIEGGLSTLLEMAKTIGASYGITVAPTCDAKYLEVGLSSKSDNVDTILGRRRSAATGAMNMWGLRKESMEATAL